MIKMEGEMSEDWAQKNFYAVKYAFHDYQETHSKKKTKIKPTAALLFFLKWAQKWSKSAVFLFEHFLK